MEEQELESGKIRKFIYVNRKAPHGTIYAHEALEVVLIAAAFEQDVSLAFIDDGVYQLKKGQNTDGIATISRARCTNFTGSLYQRGIP